MSESRNRDNHQENNQENNQDNNQDNQNKGDSREDNRDSRGSGPRSGSRSGSRSGLGGGGGRLISGLVDELSPQELRQVSVMLSNKLWMRRGELAQLGSRLAQSVLKQASVRL